MRLQRRKFLAWLATKQPRAVVGKNRDCHCCPISLFYENTSGGNEIVISSADDGGYRIHRGSGARRLPAWAEHFVRTVDGMNVRQITARRAIDVLTEEF